MTGQSIFHRNLGAALRCALIGIVITAATGCLAGYGTLARSRDVDAQFARSEVRTGYRYYTLGSQNAPRAILGIDGAYTLTTSVWTPLADLTPELLKRRVAGMTDQLGFSPGNYGGLLLTPGGTPFGVWYSPFTDVVIRFAEEGMVSVSPPREIEREGDRPGRWMRD